MRLFCKNISGGVKALVFGLVAALSLMIYPRSAAATETSGSDLLLLKLPLLASHEYYRSLSTHNVTQKRKIETNLLIALENPAEARRQALKTQFYSKAKNAGESIVQHMEMMKETFLPTQWSEKTHLHAGKESFLSQPLTRGMDVEAAKLVGFSVDTEKFSFGGGYTFGDDNPALMRKNDADEGFILGFTFNEPTWNAQVSYMNSGYDMGIYKFGGIKQQSLLFGFNYQMDAGIGFSGLLRYQDEVHNGRKRDGVTMTIGTKINF